jgi:hypothetical protein
VIALALIIVVQCYAVTRWAPPLAAVGILIPLGVLLSGRIHSLLIFVAGWIDGRIGLPSRFDGYRALQFCSYVGALALLIRYGYWLR